MIDLRSDTVTIPTDAMLHAMVTARVGDDIMGDDPTVKELEALAAELTGKQAGLFCASGTMANQIAVMAFTQRGDEVIVGDTSHVYQLESSGMAALSQTQACLIGTSSPDYDLDEIADLIRPEGVQQPHTGLLCLENTKDLNHGYVVPLENMQQASEIAHARGVPVYLDGARIFNAALVLKVTVREVMEPFDAGMFVLTKGLSCPFGSLLVGTTDFIKTARWIKQRLGGGFRQIGYMAAPGILALRSGDTQLRQDHALAQKLASALAELHLLDVPLDMVQSNIVLANVKSSNIPRDVWVTRLAEAGIRVKPIAKYNFRMVTHRSIEDADIDATIKAITGVLHG